MSRNDGIIVFKDVSYEYDATKPILKSADFVIRRGAKLTLMGQNGAGKSTLFSLITGQLQPEEGMINIQPRTTIAISRQIIPRSELELTVREFAKVFSEKVYDIDPRIDGVLEIVNLTPSDAQKDAFKDRVVGSFSEVNKLVYYGVCTYSKSRRVVVG